MPRFVKATDIPMEKRKPHLDRYKAQLRDALTNPALTPEQRVILQERLANLGKPKNYPALARQRAAQERAFAAERGQPAPPVVEPDPEPEPEAEPTNVVEDSPVVEETLDDLLAKTKRELIALAKEEGVEIKSSYTKAKISQAILDAREGE